MRDLPRTTVLLWTAVAVAAVVLGGRELMRDAAPSAGAASAGGSAAARAPGSVIAAPREGRRQVVVDVAGAVRRPGVYRLAAGARVQQALRRAGGATAGAQLALVNRAAKVVDGQQIVVPARAAPGAGAPSGAAHQPVSLSSATAEQLDQLDGVGPATADKIIAWRSANGGFQSVDDLAQVPGIGPKRLEALRPQLTP